MKRTQTSFIYINDKLIPIGRKFYVVNKETFKITEIKNNGEGNVSYNYYFETKKEAVTVSMYLELQKHLAEATLITSLSPLLEDRKLYESRVLIGIACRNILDICRSLIKSADGMDIWNKYHKIK